MTALDEFFRDARILIVDDEPANVRLLEMLLESSGFLNFRSTMDSRQALALFREMQPDLVLLDLMMPHLDGFAVLAQLRNDLTPDNYLPVMMLTANITSKARRQALQAGVRDFLTKPFDAEELDLRMRNLLEARFLHLGLQREKRSLEARVAERTTELEAALIELRQSQKQAIQQERLHAFSTMAGGVVHDFNNSLMTLQGFSELLLEPDAFANEAKAQRDARIIHRAASDAAKIVARLRHFYRPPSASDEMTAISAENLLQDTAAFTQPRWKDQARGKGREIHVEVSAPADLRLLGNASELREALINLTLNAVDAMPEGGTLTLSAAPMEGERVRLEVRDTGTGMSEETRANCLEPFFTTKGEQGTGLGLAMVFGIVRRHGGTIEITSAPGEGTAFHLTLPEATADAGRKGKRANGKRRQLRVLCVEDDAGVRELMRQFLERAGHSVTMAGDGSEALSLFSPEKFDLVLTDLSMPRTNGLTLAEEVKRRAPHQPVVMLTGFGETLLPQSGATGCLDALLTKPISSSALLEALDVAVQRGESEQHAA